jgi:hypothetical protein
MAWQGKARRGVARHGTAWVRMNKQEKANETV